MKAVGAEFGGREGWAEAGRPADAAQRLPGGVVRRRLVRAAQGPGEGLDPGVVGARRQGTSPARSSVADGWRKTNLTWRPSMLDILPSLPFVGDDLTAAGEEKARPAGGPGRVPPGRRRPRDAGGRRASRAGDVVVGFDGVTVDGAIGDLLGYVRRNYWSAMR